MNRFVHRLFQIIHTFFRWKAWYQTNRQLKLSREREWNGDSWNWDSWKSSNSKFERPSGTTWKNWWTAFTWMVTDIRISSPDSAKSQNHLIQHHIQYHVKVLLSWFQPQTQNVRTTLIYSRIDPTGSSKGSLFLSNMIKSDWNSVYFWYRPFWD